MTELDSYHQQHCLGAEPDGTPQRCVCHEIEVQPLDPHTHARNSDPGTSHAAAATLDKAALLDRLLRAFAGLTHAGHYGGTATSAEITALLGLSAAQGVWKRVSDLRALGLIVDAGERRTGPSGRSQIAWRITEDGWQVATGHADWPTAKRAPRDFPQPESQLAQDLVDAESEIEPMANRVEEVIARHRLDDPANKYARTLVTDLLRAIGREIDDGTLPL